jgi:hypothetical protein
VGVQAGVSGLADPRHQLDATGARASPALGSEHRCDERFGWFSATYGTVEWLGAKGRWLARYVQFHLETARTSLKENTC